MQLEDYFNFLSGDDIRIKGTRIGIESVLYEYIHRAQEPKAIVQFYHTLSLETGLRNDSLLSAQQRKGWCVFGRLPRILSKVERGIREKSTTCSGATATTQSRA